MIKQAALFILFSAATSYAEQTPSPQEMLAAAKVSGACGIMRQMINFQESTKIQNGDDFISRFWATEAARLGQTIPEYIEQCNNALAWYDKFNKALSTP